MDPKKILFLCDASDIDIVDKSFAESEQYELTIETTEKIFDFGVKSYLETTIDLVNQYPYMYDGIVGTHDSSAVFAAIICESTGHRFASLQSIINCQNKYLSRNIQKACLPSRTPAYCLDLDYLQDTSRLRSPFFIKPVRSNISFAAHIISTPEDLHHFIGLESQDIAFYNQYFLEAISCSSEAQDEANLSTCNRFLCEEIIKGEQVTVDGFVFDQVVHFLGMTKAVFHPDTNAFSHHEYPYSYNPELDAKIEGDLSTLIPKLGINNSFFNVELRADEKNNTFNIIEINARIAFQFAKTIQAVKGCDPLILLCDVATGQKPAFTNASNCVYPYCLNFELHSFQDKKIIKTPTQSGYEEIKINYPEIYIRNLIQENTKLSDYKHTPDSYRYCVIDIPGNNRQEIMHKFAQVTAMLQYEFEEVEQ